MHVHVPYSFISAPTSVKASIYTLDIPAFIGGACSGDYGMFCFAEMRYAPIEAQRYTCTYESFQMMTNERKGETEIAYIT